jgi:hypothetical protein
MVASACHAARVSERDRFLVHLLLYVHVRISDAVPMAHDFNCARGEGAQLVLS